MTLRAWLRYQPKVALVAAAIVLATGSLSWIVGLEALVRARLDRDGAAAPTRLYGRPLVLQAGTRIERERVERHLRRLGYREARGRTVALGEYALRDWTWTIGRRPFRLADRMDPGGVTRVELGWDDEVVSVEDGEGSPQPYLFLEPEVLHTVHGDDLADRVPVGLGEVPQHLVDAVLAMEDRRFFDHHGLDYRRIVGAALANARAGRTAQGASTVTQQLARTRWLSTNRSPWRKIREAAMALRLESRYTKQEILEAYLNEVYLGQDGAFAIRGVGRAAQFYFSKDVTQLDPSEAALLAGIIRGPNLYSPFRHPETAKQRRDLVLDLMRERDLLSEREHRIATRSPVRLRKSPSPDRTSRYFADWVLQDLPRERGLTVFTTVDPELQRVAEEAVREGLERLERARPDLVGDGQPIQAALVALNPWTGEVLAMVGGRDYGVSQFNRAVQARRQPGSAFKPIVALAALAPDPKTREVSGLTPGLSPGLGTGAPAAITLATEIDDEPLALETPAGLWQPVNYDGEFRGRVTLRQALERSLNVPFARLGLAVGPARIAETGRALGIESPLHPVPSLALGSSEVSLLELTRAFSVLAAYGYRAKTVGTLGVVDAHGELLERTDLRGEQVIPPAVTYLVTSALEGAVERGTGRGLRAFGLDVPVAAKSGTSNDHRDAWFVGYTPRLAVGVWVGFDDGRSVGVPGAGAALPIFARFLARAVPDGRGERFPVPDGVEFADAGPGCETEVFLTGTVPDRGCAPYWLSVRPLRDGVRSLSRALRRLLGGR